MKKVFITGSSSGIGYAAAKAFALDGYEVFINGRNESKLKKAEESLKAFGGIIALAGDVSDYMQAERIIGEIGDIDVLVNNAGISRIGLFNTTSHEEWENILKNNIGSTMNCSHIAIKRMISRHSGNIINISSIWGNVGASCEVAYSASKGAINSFTRALAKEAAPSGVRVNAVACGVIDTEMNSFLSEEERQALIDEIPASRFGTPDEAAELILFLASEKAAYLNGQIITLDGAML